MRFMIWSMFAWSCLACSCFAAKPSEVTLKKLDQTVHLQTASGFNFNLSPDNQWLLFFTREDAPERPEVHHLYGHLHVMNIKTSEIFEFTVREDEGPQYPMHDVDASWAPDSSMCVLPSPPIKDRCVIIKFSKGEKPSVSYLPDPGDLKSGETLPQLPETFACSDCFSHTDDFELLKKHIAKEFLFVGSITPNEDEYQIVSPDGSKIYYQKGPQGVELPDVTHATTLYELDIATGKERQLVVHEGDCPIISHLRPSPDGKKLAYQVTTGCGFIGVPQIYVLDLATGKTQSITFGDGTMHWSSASDKLFFYRRWVEGEHGDYIWVAEFPSQTPASQPATSPASPSTGQ